MESKLADQDQVKEVHSKRGRQYNDDDYRQLEDLMYDRMSLRLEAAQLIMGPDVDTCMRTVEDPHGSGKTELHILERINMSFSVQHAIVDAPTLTRFKITGELPELQVNFSDRKYSMSSPVWCREKWTDPVRNFDEVYRYFRTAFWG